MNWIRKELKSIGFALNGMVQFSRSGSHAVLELLISILVIVSGIWVELSLNDWVVVLSMIAGVIVLEMVNTAIELLCDKVEPNEDPAIGIIKDLSAGAVLVMCTAAAIVGILIFGKYLLWS